MNENCVTCPLHSGHDSDISNLKNKTGGICLTLKTLDDKVDNKVSMKLFLGILAIIAVFMMGIGSTQMYLIEKVAHIEEKTNSTYDLVRDEAKANNVTSNTSRASSDK